MSLQFGSKADTLSMLQGNLHTARVLPLLAFSTDVWQSSAQQILLNIRQAFPGVARFIVRSSCLAEDTSEGSNAGAYLSLLGQSFDQLEAAVAQVFLSYGRLNPADQVLIQPMLSEVICSGVAFSHDPSTCAPYRIVNWHDSDDTSFVTSGQGGRCWQGAAQLPSNETTPPAVALVLPLLDELLKLFGEQPVDCEFAITRDQQLWLLQARPLLLQQTPQTAVRQHKLLALIATKVSKGMQPHPFLMGQRTVYGVMPDWNPAEIIGIRPKPLALSLYRELVTDAIWAYQRHNYGYRNLRSFPLMPHFFGLPYIDVRLSFNSFIPADLNESLAGRLVDYYIRKLQAQPTLHDKVEFEIVFSCYTPDLPERLQALKAEGFSQSELDQIADSLRRLTNNIIDPNTGLWRIDADKLHTLNQRREKILASNLDPAAQIYWLLEDAKRYGTLPFAGLARAGFIAVQLLKSLVSVGVFSTADFDAFMASLQTVSGQLSHDRQYMEKSIFLSKYGHLRPGTYDILSERYDEAPQRYFDFDAPAEACQQSHPLFSLTLVQMRKLGELLRQHDLNPDVVGLFDFLQAGIELRELAKFHFTRNLSDALALITQLACQYGFDRDDIAFCDIQTLQELHVAACDPQQSIRDAIARGKARYQDTASLSLPPLISDVSQIYQFEWPETAPNFITQKQTTAAVVDCHDKSLLAGKIVCIPNADPGYDWLFAYPIAGLITAWGGANSHMAIRAGELGLPAIIGAGERSFRQWSAASRLHIDCAGRRVEIIA
ncbi:MAG: phosphoenolpyruvate synthase [Gammaproteobacteria bacterium]|nr:phosphoenolpyruvate synthase [Gammaproteobacteria bacterium]